MVAFGSASAQNAHRFAKACFAHIVDVECGDVLPIELRQIERVEHPLNVFHAVGVRVEIDVAVAHGVRGEWRSVQFVDAFGSGGCHLLFGAEWAQIDLFEQIDGVARVVVEHRPERCGFADEAASVVENAEVARRRQAVAVARPSFNLDVVVHTSVVRHFEVQPRKHPRQSAFGERFDAKTERGGRLAGRIEQAVAQSRERLLLRKIDILRHYVVFYPKNSHRLFAFWDDEPLQRLLLPLLRIAVVEKGGEQRGNHAYSGTSAHIFGKMLRQIDARVGTNHRQHEE